MFTAQKGDFCPTPVRGKTKYGEKGGCTSDLLKSLQLPEGTAQALSELGNLGITRSTWSTYKTAKTMLSKCESETKVDLSLPFDQKKTLIFIDWLARTRGLKRSTINSYLAGIRQLHIIQGLEEPTMHTGLVKLVLRGLANKEGIEKRTTSRTGRMPMTPRMMLVLKNLLITAKLSNHDKRLVWSVSTMAFAGAFRIGEILSKHESTYDPSFTLLTEDVTWSKGLDGKTTLHICLKCPKETKSAAPTTVDIYQNDGPLCPIKAFMTWRNLKNRDRNMPMFRAESGTPFTGGKLNKILRELLDPYVDRSLGTFSAHSFRIGIATILGSRGYTDEEIKAAGRWSSRAFESYTRLTRTKRALMGKQISTLHC